MVDLQSLIVNAKSEIFRLELLGQYKVDGEWEEFQKYLRGEKLSEDEELEEFCKFISETGRQGIRHLRIHVVPRILTPYLRFEIETGYIPMSKSGASFLFIEQSEYHDVLHRLFKEKFHPNDFWLIDNEVVAELKYDHDGIFKEAILIQEQESVQKYIKLKNTLIDKGTDFRQWINPEKEKTGI